MKILDENFKQFKCVICDKDNFAKKTAYVGGRDFRPKLRFSCSIATALQRFVPPWPPPTQHNITTSTSKLDERSNHPTNIGTRGLKELDFEGE